MRSIRSRAPSASSTTVRRVMQANRSRDTKPEIQLRRALHRAGLRFRKDVRPLAPIKCAKADVVFSRAKLCIFVDGCFWHGCPRHFSAPKTNQAWWKEKIADNRLRDRKKTRQLRRAGWTVLRIWEHELQNARFQSWVQQVSRLVSEGGPG